MSEKRVIPAPVWDGSPPSESNPHWAKHGGPTDVIARITDKVGVVDAPLDGDGNRILARNEFLTGNLTADHKPYLDSLLREKGMFGPQSAAEYQVLVNEAQRLADAEYRRSWDGIRVQQFDRTFPERCSAEFFAERLDKWMPCPEAGLMTGENGKRFCGEHASASSKTSAALFRIVKPRDRSKQ